MKENGAGEDRTVLIRVPEDKVTEGDGFYWVDLGDFETVMRMLMMAYSNPDKAVVRDEGEMEE